MKIKYVCDECNTMYDTVEEALLCEENHRISLKEQESSLYAIELHIPKKPINQILSNNDSACTGECPNCRNIANSYMKACLCGQALDWTLL